MGGGPGEIRYAHFGLIHCSRDEPLPPLRPEPTLQVGDPLLYNKLFIEMLYHGQRKATVMSKVMFTGAGKFYWLLTCALYIYIYT